MRPNSEHQRRCREADRRERWAEDMKRQVRSLGHDPRWIGGVDINRPLPRAQATKRERALARYDELMDAFKSGWRPGTANAAWRYNPDAEAQLAKISRPSVVPFRSCSGARRTADLMKARIDMITVRRRIGRLG